MRIYVFAISFTIVILQIAIFGQTARDKGSVEQQEQKKLASEALAAEQRTFAVSQLISLADAARSYHDVALRPHVLTRVADTIWDADSDAGRRIFRRAWEAAEAADTEAASQKTDDRQLMMVAALKRASGIDSRNEVLRTAARRDRALGEEFLAKLKEQTKDSGSNKSSGGDSSEDLARRLQLARNLLDDNQVDQALAFAAPALNQVNMNSIAFLSDLRVKAAARADERFARLMAQAEFDPTSDANTASLLSSYAFTPGYYITFNQDGGASWSFGEGKLPPPDLPSALRAAFFRVAAAILLRPLPPPDQDYTTCGRVGEYMVINRLLPLFDRYQPDSATALRSQLASLRTETAKNRLPESNQMSQSITAGVETRPSPGDILQRMQDRLDHARASKERDSICRDTASELADQGDPRAKDVADKIDDTDMRNKVRGYVDFQLVRFALKKKEAIEGVRLAKAGQLTHAERVWAYVQAARLLSKSQRLTALDLLEEGAIEARRIDASDPDRARGLFALATQFVPIDGTRAWYMIAEAVKAANDAEAFTGEDTSIRNLPVVLRAGGTFESTTDEDFGIRHILSLLAKDDLYRCMEVAKSFKRDGPRSSAIIAIAAATLEKSEAKDRK